MDESRVCELYERFKDGIFRYILSLTGDSHLAEDVLQETFVRLLRANKIPDTGKEQAWLYKVARNRCFDMLRKRRRQEEPAEIVINKPDDSFEFFELISPLSEKEREIVSLRFVGGFTHTQIARIMGTTVAATKKRYERAIKKLRDSEDNYD
ncbi:MAG: sigma-70 family RNA polymerase sigma factor [Anaerofustis stercorihominis]|nr:sigma-70 family RNA polymerase sigma factor [Anaerofustis stercorihominis]